MQVLRSVGHLLGSVFIHLGGESIAIGVTQSLVESHKDDLREVLHKLLKSFEKRTKDPGFSAMVAQVTNTYFAAVAQREHDAPKTKRSHRKKSGSAGGSSGGSAGGSSSGSVQ